MGIASISELTEALEPYLAAAQHLPVFESWPHVSFVCELVSAGTVCVSLVTGGFILPSMGGCTWEVLSIFTELLYQTLRVSGQKWVITFIVLWAFPNIYKWRVRASKSKSKSESEREREKEDNIIKA